MIQQQTKLCLGAMKLLQWPNLSRGAVRALWPASMKGQITVLPYSFSSTMAQTQKPTENETQSSQETTTTESSKQKSPDSESKSSSNINNANVKKETIKQIISLETKSKEVEAILKARALSSALEICTDFTSEQRLHALKNLTVVKSRPIPLIKNLTEGLADKVNELNVKEISDLLFYLGKLSYVNENVLSKTCEALKRALKKTTNPAVVGSSIQSLQRLRWKDSELLNEFSVWVEANINKFQSPSSFIHTLALQNHPPPNLEKLLKLTWDRTHKESLELVNLVWSIKVLNQSHPSLDDEVQKAVHGFFNKRFLDKLGSGPKSYPIWIKLWNLHSIAKSTRGLVDFTVPDYVKSSVSKASMKKDKESMVSDVTALLFPERDFSMYSTNVPSQMGFPIDLVFSVNKEMKAVPVHLASSSSAKIAVMIHSYFECCHPTKEPNGIRVFEMRLLEDEYNVISVPYHLLGSGFAQIHGYFESVLSQVVRKIN